MTLTEGIKGKPFALWIDSNAPFGGETEHETAANSEMEAKMEKLRVKLNFIDSEELYVNWVCGGAFCLTVVPRTCWH